MRKVVHKNFWAWQVELEEKWINEMSAQGWHLLAVSPFRYEFEQGDKGEYCYRLELLGDWPTHPKSMEYIRFVEETGAEFIGRVKRWVYFRKRTADGEFELFSDIKSRLTVNSRYVALLGTVTAVECCYLVPAIYFALTVNHAPPVGLWVIILFNLFVALLLLGGLCQILRQRKRLKRELAVRE